MTQDRLQDVIRACHRILDSRQTERAAVVERDQALRAWWPESGVPKRGAGPALQRALADAGWTPDQIASVGLGADSVEKTLGRRQQ